MFLRGMLLWAALGVFRNEVSSGDSSLPKIRGHIIDTGPTDRVGLSAVDFSDFIPENSFSQTWRMVFDFNACRAFSAGISAR